MRRLTLFLSSFLATQAVAINYSDGSFGNYNFLSHSALGKCVEKDGKAFTSTLNAALNRASDGSIIQWRNEKTGNYGRIQVLKDPAGQSNCRLARIATTDKSIQGQEMYQFCKQNDKWVAHPR